ncbi:MAG: hypothetical protein FWC69_02125 [Defluviitaleaceae bacterium]|nr:hypothetical protein [Defluviitaleaceae bacterium]
MIRSTNKVISNILGIVGLCIFGAALIVFGTRFFIDHDIARFSLLITAASLALPSLILLAISAGFRGACRKQQDKLARLKDRGEKFECEIKKLHRHVGVNFVNSSSIFAECSYTNKEGATRTVRSENFMHEWADVPSKEDYSAVVYVNPSNNQDYAVEISR